MGSNNSSTVAPCAAQASESKTISIACQNSSPTDQIRRLAIDQSAMIGSLYDAKVDCFLQQPQHTCQSEIKKSEEIKDRLFCTIIKDGETDSKTSFDQICLDENLRLSVLLNMTPRNNLSQLVEHSFQITTCTRLLFYRYIGEEKYLVNKNDGLKLNYGKTIQNVPATHFVSGVRTGVLAVIKFEVLSHDEKFVAPVLKKMKEQLIESNIHFNAEDRVQLEKLQYVKVFSNITKLEDLSELGEICKIITDMKQNASDHRLLDYTLRPIKAFFSDALVPNHSKYSPLTSAAISRIGKHLDQLSSLVKTSQELLTHEIEDVLKTHLSDQLSGVKQEISKVEEDYKDRLEEIRKYVSEMRGGKSDDESMPGIKIQEYETSFAHKINNIRNQYTNLEQKVRLIEDLKNKKIKFWNVKQFVKDNDHDLESVRTKLITKSGRTIMYCFDDRLENFKSEKWNDFYRKMLNESQKKPEYQYVYTDFTYCACQLTKMNSLRSQDLQEETSLALSPSMNSPPSPSSPKEKPYVPNKNCINVLLLGESGVGKSTFINALVNYLKFESLKEAKSKRPISVMPVSFLITEGDDFKERVVTFGEPDSNENHNKTGQSVTQQCRSYVFTVGTQTKMRLIDTPGMGDTRGLAQDDQNMQHILSFISQLSHLNAICILLKPNEAKLNVVLRSYFTRLIGFLGKNVCKNIIFCFTNTRTTFFAPGNTGPLLRKMIESYPSEDIRFTKENTFCFDNESFRYLIALLNDVKFNDDQRKEYKQSWRVSVTESNRFLQYVCGILGSYPQKDWQSVEHAHFLISQLVRPMLETMRNHFRNLISQEKYQSARMIELRPFVLSRPSTLCLKCKGILQYFNGFGILVDDVHMCFEKCEHCACDREQHMTIDYRLNYQLCSDAKKSSVDEINHHIKNIQRTIIKFGQFFNNSSHVPQQNDEILFFLNHMIEEENKVVKESDRGCLNSKLLQLLEKFKEEYSSVSNGNSIELVKVYRLIEEVSAMNEIKEPLDVIHQYKQKCMAEQETQLN